MGIQKFSNSKNSKKESGLSLSEVKKLQEKYGRNEIETKAQSALVRFLKKFIEPISLMIEAALVLSIIAGKWEDFTIIAILLAVNILVDFFQEEKANKALQALKSTLSPTAVVLRDGVFNTINAAELVVGDVVKLIIGDVAPADMVLLDDVYSYVDQSAITGESLSVEKKKGDIVYASSIIQKGKFLARVTQIGEDSSIGKDVALVAQAEREEQSHFQKAVLGIGKFLMALSSVLIIIVFIVLMSRGDSFVESIRFVLVLAVASIPVALPAVLSVTMAIGAAALAKRNAIVSNFKSIEELAGVDQLCVDKTGTLTKNKIAVSEPKVYGDFKMSDLFTYALLASENENKSPIEKAIYSYAKKNNIEGQVTEYGIDKFIPFDPVRKMTEVLVHTETDVVSIIMGAPQVVIKQIGETSLSESLSHDVEELAQNGFRTLFVARKIVSKNDNILLPVGVIPLIDPPRDDSKSTIFEIKQRGVDVKMLTGDNTAIAKFIANILDVGTSIMKSSAFHNMRKTNASVDKDDMEIIAKTNVFAEVVPEDKYHIVDVLQKHGHIVAMTGDGVNDAPALKKADIGIAVSGASPAARSAADIVLLDNGLSVIKDTIDNARMIFARMQSYVMFRIALTIRILFFITLSVLIFNYSPLTAIMVILLALLNDIPVMSIAYDNAPVSEKPIRWHLRDTIFISTILGITGLVSSFALFYWLNVNGFSIAIIQTILFLKLDVAGHSTLYLTRTGRKHFWERPFPSLKFFIPAFSSRILGTIIVFFGILMDPISWQYIVYIWAYSILWFLLNDWIKVWSYKLLDKIKKHKAEKVERIQALQ